MNSIMKKPKRAGMLSAAALLSTFILAAFVDMTDKFEFLRYLTPFKYFDTKEIFINRGYNVYYILASLTFIMALFFISKKYFTKRDLDI